MVSTMLYGPAISQSDFIEASPYQLPYNNYYLLTGCKGRTRKYKPKVFHENQGLYFLVRHEHPVSK